MSGYQDSNLGPPAPKAGTLTGLRYTPNVFLCAEAVWDPPDSFKSGYANRTALHPECVFLVENSSGTLPIPSNRDTITGMCYIPKKYKSGERGIRTLGTVTRTSV